MDTMTAANTSSNSEKEDTGAHAPFLERHIGPRCDEVIAMVKELGFSSLDELIDRAVPDAIRSKKSIALRDFPIGVSEQATLKRLRRLALLNKIYRSYIGMGYYGTETPGVIQRNILENPGWYTQYTPYQPEIS